MSQATRDLRNHDQHDAGSPSRIRHHRKGIQQASGREVFLGWECRLRSCRERLCSGSTVNTMPSDALQRIRTARAKDGLPVVIVLKPLRSVATLLVARKGGHVVGELRLDIAKSELQSST